MDELVRNQGSVSKNGKIAFVPQEAFLTNDTLKNNVLFGLEYEQDRYTNSVQVA